MANEIRVCKNRKCQKPLPTDYKHKYCEACRNKQVQGLKKAGKVVVGIAEVVGCVAVVIAKGGKNNTQDD